MSNVWLSVVCMFPWFSQSSQTQELKRVHKHFSWKDCEHEVVVHWVSIYACLYYRQKMFLQWLRAWGLCSLSLNLCMCLYYRHFFWQLHVLFKSETKQHISNWSNTSHNKTRSNKHSTHACKNVMCNAFRFYAFPAWLKGLIKRKSDISYKGRTIDSD